MLSKNSLNFHVISFIDKLKTNISEKNSNLCVGIDIDKKYFNKNVSIDELMDYSYMVVDATKDLAAAYKPNLAFFEEWGSKGFYWLEQLVKEIGNEHIIIADAKRGDIGNTGLHYANAFFNHLNCDAITISPYMGEESIQPFITHTSKGVYVLCRTSNKTSSYIQEEIYSKVISLCNDLNSNKNIGLVVGATNGQALQAVRSKSDLPFLIPGIGAQGGDLKSVIKINSNHMNSTLINISRGIIFADSKDYSSARASAKNYLNQMRAING